jgi:hypothetical protein
MATDEQILASVRPGKPPADCPVLGAWRLRPYIRERALRADGVIAGLGTQGYTLALRRLAHLLDKRIPGGRVENRHPPLRTAILMRRGTRQ